MVEDITANWQRYLERVELYKRFGYDIDQERMFFLDKAMPFYGNILEVGTGKGYLTIALAQEGYNFTTVDISEQEQQYARLNIKHLGLEDKVDFQVANAEKLSFKNDSFDIIICRNTIHHLINPFVVVDELIRVVSPNGKIILSDFSKEGLEVVSRIHRQEGRNHEHTGISLDRISRYLGERRVRVEDCRTEFQEILVVYC